MHHTAKALITTTLALSVLLLGAAPGLADQNQLGIYTDAGGDHATASISIAPFTPFEAYLVLENPYNPSVYNGSEYLERPMSLVGGFYAGISVPEEGFYMLSMTPPVEDYSYEGNYPDIGFGYEGVPVPGSGIVVLATLSMMVEDLEPKHVFLGPSDLPGAFYGLTILDASTDPQDYEFSMVAAVPSSGSFDLPVFGINTDVVSTEDRTLEAVKALYR